MGFSTALSGLNAASNNLTVIGNNIANANTYGFKESRSEFVDSYADSIADSSKAQPGTGVRLAQVAQQFNQGNVELTGNTLDMAINGEGFFTLAETPGETDARVYSRNGAFHVNKDGVVVNNNGQALLAYKPNGPTVNEGFSTGGMGTISLDIGSGSPTPTSKINMDLNLDASRPRIDSTVLPFDPSEPKTYDRETSINVFDSLGVSHRLTTYFVPDPDPAPTVPPTPVTERTWTVHHYITDDPKSPKQLDDPANPVKLTFDAKGKLIDPVDGKVKLPKFTAGTASSELDITMDYTGSSQLSTAFSVDTLKQDGLPAGTFTNITINDKGIIFANFSNGGTSPLGKIVLTRFTNPQGLSKLGDGAWAESSTSGFPLLGNANEGNFGTIQSGALEQSNVDLSKQLVNLIIAQQTYQANSQTIQTENSSIQTIMNLR